MRLVLKIIRNKNEKESQKNKIKEIASHYVRIVINIEENCLGWVRKKKNKFTMVKSCVHLIPCIQGKYNLYKLSM